MKSKTTGAPVLGGSTGYNGASERSRRTHARFGELRQDEDEAWDARGYREEHDDGDTEMHHQRGRASYPPVSGGYLAGTNVDDEPPRGRSRSREPPYPTGSGQNQHQQRWNPPRASMDSFTGVSVKGGRSSPDGERRSVFREAM